MMLAKQVADKASDLVSLDRRAVHGSPSGNHRRIARLWSAYLDAIGVSIELTAKDVALMMVLLKVARTTFGANNLDDYVDAAGYAACAGEIASMENGAEE